MTVSPTARPSGGKERAWMERTVWDRPAGSPAKERRHSPRREVGGAGGQPSAFRSVQLGVGETVILLHPPLPLVGISIRVSKRREQNDCLADG